MKINKVDIVNLDYLKDFFDFVKSKGERNFDMGFCKILHQVRISFEIEELLPFEFEVLKGICKNTTCTEIIDHRPGVLDKFGDRISVEYKESIQKQNEILKSIKEKIDIDLFEAYSPMNVLEYSVLCTFTSTEIMRFFGSDFFDICENIHDIEKFKERIANYFFNYFYKSLYAAMSYNSITHVSNISESSEEFIDKKIFSLIDKDKQILLYSIYGNKGKFKFVNSDSTDKQEVLKEIIKMDGTKVSFIMNTSYLVYFKLLDYVVCHSTHYLTMISNNYFTKLPEETKSFEIRMNEVMNELNNELVYSIHDKNIYDPAITPSYTTMNMKIKYMIDVDIDEIINFDKSKLYYLLNNIKTNMGTDIFVKDITSQIYNVSNILFSLL